MSQYYFLVASLPFLSYDMEAAQSPDDFIAMAAEHLSAADYQVVSAATIDAPVELAPGPPVITEWQRFERGLRNELVKLRAPKLGTDPAEYVRTDEAGNDDTERGGLSDSAREAVSEVSPLAGEDVLGRARWSFLSDLEVGHFFDVDRLVVYYLQLQLIARKRQFNTEDGKHLFTAATEKIIKDYYQEQGDL